jgi:hypothetical protein
MMNWLFNQIASTICNSPYLMAAIKTYAASRPYSHLKHNDGSPYMDRWWLMPRWMLAPDETGHLFPKDRWWVPLKIRLHHIHTADYDRDLHDHPADYRTLLIDGYYREENVLGERNLYLAGQSRCARAETFHRIQEVSYGGVWTIFIMGKKRLSWGFLVGGHKVPWRKYVSKGLAKKSKEKS